jgi:mutator protein MutT
MTKNCANIILIRDNKILLVKRSFKSKHEPGSWSLPGGTCEDEETIEECLIREIKEELNMIIINKKYFKSFIIKNKDTSLTRAFYFFGDVKGDIKLNQESEEFCWFDINKIPEKMAFSQDKILKEFKNYLSKQTY